MKNLHSLFNRRNFFKASATAATGLVFMPEPSMAHATNMQDSIHIIGPKEGFSPHVGTLLSMMTWMRTVVLWSVGQMKKEELDYLHDSKANTIGGMLLHLAATERVYQGMTMNVKLDYTEVGKIDWDAAMHLGDEGRKSIKGNTLEFYKNVLLAVRNRTTEEMKKRDDNWLMEIDQAFFENKPTNNYCKWFHVCEHESNHNGQIKWIKGRLPGAKAGND